MASGVSVSSPPITLTGTANAVSQKYFQRVLADSYSRPSPTLWRLSRTSRKFEGGAAITWPVVYQEETVGGAYWGTQILDTSAVDSVQPAEVQWRQYNQPITIPYTDILLNRGFGVLNLVKAKEETAMMSMIQKLNRAVWGTAPQNSAIDLDPLSTSIGTTSRTYAGISSATNTWWAPGGTRNGVLTASGNLVISDLQTAYGDVTFGNEEPDTLIFRQQGFNAYHGLLIGNIRYDRDEETTRMGFRRHLMFNNAVVFHDQFATSQTGTFLNSKYGWMVFHVDDYFVIDPFIRPSNQRILSSFIWVTLQLQIINPRMFQTLVTITNG